VTCLDFDPLGRYFSLGSADALSSIWDIQEHMCLMTFGMDSPLRTQSISNDGEFIALGSEEHLIPIYNVFDGACILDIKTNGATNSIEWHPIKPILAYACDETDRYGRSEGSISIKSFSL
jgi:THO complex subunit 3